MIFKEQNKTNSKDTTIDLGLVKGNGHCVEVREKKDSVKLFFNYLPESKNVTNGRRTCPSKYDPPPLFVIGV